MSGEPSMSDGDQADTTEELGDEVARVTALPTESAAPSSYGWRKWLRLATFGAVELGPSPDETQMRYLKAVVDGALRGTHSVVVLGGKGGAGKTTTAIGVGSMFALLHHKVIAIDGNPDIGANLGDRVDPSTTSSYREVLAENDIHQYADLRAHVGNSPASGLDVLAANRDVSDRKLLDTKTYLATHERLRRFYSVLVTDSGTNVEHPVVKGLLETADTVILVAACTPDSAQATGKMIDWLANSRHGDLLAHSVVVLNDVTGRADRAMIGTLTDLFTRRLGSGRVFLLPYDPHLATARSIDFGQLRRRTHRRFLEITAAAASKGAADPPVAGSPDIPHRNTFRLALIALAGVLVVGCASWFALTHINASARSAGSTSAPTVPGAVTDWLRANVPAGTHVLTDGATSPTDYPGTPLPTAGQGWRDYSYLMTDSTSVAAPSDAARAAVWTASIAVAVFDDVQIRRILVQLSPDQIQHYRDIDRDDRRRAADALQSNPRVALSSNARQVLERGDLDQRPAVVIAGLTEQTSVTVVDIGIVEPEAAAGVPAHSAAISTPDPTATTTSVRAVLPLLAPDRIELDPTGVIHLHWPLNVTPIPSVN
jgi:MinD-like ATPase involved in chromosome partitioning or flagellar assembly